MTNPRAAVLSALLAVALSVSVSCSDGDGASDRSTTTTSTTTASTTTSNPTTSTEPSGTTSGSTAPPDDPGEAEAELPTDAEAWMTDLVRAWGRGDHDRVGQLATADVGDQLFAFADPGGSGWSATGCEGAAGTVYCTFETEFGERVVFGQRSAPDESTGQLLPVDRVTLTSVGE